VRLTLRFTSLCLATCILNSGVYNRDMTVKRRPSNSIRGGSSAGFIAVLAVAVVGGGLFLSSRQPPESKSVIKEDNLTQVAALARAEKDAERLQHALREHQVILGMTFREVESAKGRPAAKLRDDSLADADRTKGAVEKWTYPVDGGAPAVVLFGANGLVIYSSEVGDNPLPAQMIRQ
jgi:hypothetical protein